MINLCGDNSRLDTSLNTISSPVKENINVSANPHVVQDENHPQMEMNVETKAVENDNQLEEQERKYAALVTRVNILEDRIY